MLFDKFILQSYSELNSEEIWCQDFPNNCYSMYVPPEIIEYIELEEDDLEV